MKIINYKVDLTQKELNTILELLDKENIYNRYGLNKNSTLLKLKLKLKKEML